MDIRLFNGWPDAVIVVLGLLMMAIFVGVLVATWRRRLSVARSRSWQTFLGHFVPLFPLLGILGTVIGLMDTMAYLGTEGSGRLAGAIDRFGVAMSTTFWGIIFCVSLTVVGVIGEHLVAEEGSTTT
jgi:hypothetical protein